MSKDRKRSGSGLPRSERLAFTLIGVVTALVVFLIGTTVYPRLPGPPPPGSGRVEANAALTQVAAGALQVIDARDASLYASGHLPGAVSIPVADLRDSEYGTLATPTELATRLDRAGIRPDRGVLVYADMLADAAYVGWALVALGHERVRLLDGGVSAWLASDGALESEPAEPQGVSTSDRGNDGGPGLWQARADERWPKDRVLDLFDLYAGIDDPDLVLVDTRQGDERNAAIQSGADDTDHNVSWTQLVSEDGRAFKNRMTLHRALQVLPARKQLVVYGDDSTASALVWWSLYEHGYGRVARFDESFDSWAAMGFPTRAVEAQSDQADDARLGGGCG